MPLQLLKMLNRYIALIAAFILQMNTLAGQEHAAFRPGTLAELLVNRLGNPDERRDLRGVSLDYRLKDGQILTITTKPDGSVWAGLKFDLAANLDKQVTLVGIYLGPGKEANYLFTHDSQVVYLNLLSNGGSVPTDLMLGDEIEVAGTLQSRPGSNSKRTEIAASPTLFHVDKPIVRIVNKKTIRHE